MIAYMALARMVLNAGKLLGQAGQSIMPLDCIIRYMPVPFALPYSMHICNIIAMHLRNIFS